MSKKKYIKTFITSLFMVFLIGQICAPEAFAEEGEGWIEVQVSVPENFNDQIYIQFQEEGKEDEAFYDNFIQILPENNYTGRIKLPVGKYVVTCNNTYENPLIYNVELDSDTDYPIAVTSDTTATLVKFNCKPVPIEDLPEIAGEYPQEILEAAQKASDEKAEAEKDNELTTDNSGNTVIDSSKADEEEDKKTYKDPLHSILTGLFSTVVFIIIFGAVGYYVFNYKKGD